MLFSYFFPETSIWHLCELSLFETVCFKFQNLFAGKIRKYISIGCLLKILLGVLSVNYFLICLMNCWMSTEQYGGWVVSSSDFRSQGPRFESSWRRNSAHDSRALCRFEHLIITLPSSCFDCWLGGKTPGPSCSKLTTSLVNDSLKFALSDTQICWNFLLKNIFSAKNMRILYIESAKTDNEMTLNELALNNWALIVNIQMV